MRTMKKSDNSKPFFPFIENPHYSTNVVKKQTQIEEGKISTLPREVYKWIQCLDLTFPVKNVRKDFSNGFLIAQILNRYFYSKYFPMHTIENGFSQTCKANNWTLIESYMKKVDHPITSNNPQFWKGTDLSRFIKDSAIDEILKFLISLFQELTKRRVDPVEANKKFVTDIDNLNKSYLLKENGEIEPFKKDHEPHDAASNNSEIMQQKSIASKSFRSLFRNEQPNHSNEQISERQFYYERRAKTYFSGRKQKCRQKLQYQV